MALEYGRKPRLLFERVKPIIADKYPDLAKHMNSDLPLQKQSGVFKAQLGKLRHQPQDPLYLEYCKRHPLKDLKRPCPDTDDINQPKKQRIDDQAIHVDEPILEVFPIDASRTDSAQLVHEPSRWPDLPEHLVPAFDVHSILMLVTNQFTASLDYAQHLHEEHTRTQRLHLERVAILKRRLNQLEVSNKRLRDSEERMADEVSALQMQVAQL